MVSVFLIDIIILLIAAVAIVPLSQAVRLGAVPGFLIAGVVVGPYGLGLISNVSEIGHFAEIGVVFLLSVIGIELKPARLWQMRRTVFGLGSLQVLLTGIVLGSVGYAFFGMSGRTALLVGPTLALSSTAFVLQLLSEQKLLSSNYGRTSFSVLLLQDLAIVPLLALVPLLAMPELSLEKDVGLALIESMLILVLVIFAGRYLLHPILHRVALSGNSEVFTASAVLLVLGSALATEYAGLSMAMGAFLAGVLISDSSYRHQVLAEIQPFRGLLLGLFFVSMGMSLDLNLLFDSPIISFGLLGLLIAIKAAVLFPLAFWFGLEKRGSLAVSLVLAQSGEFALVLFSLAFQHEILSQELYQQLLLTVLLSMLVTPILAYIAQRLVRSPIVEKRKDSDEECHVHQKVEGEESLIVLAGFGRVGHRIGEVLKLAGKPFVALDSDPSLVERECQRGHNVFYGDVCKHEILKAAGASHAQVIIVTLNDPVATKEVITSLRRLYPDKSIYARGHNLSQSNELHRLGASGVVSENVEASLELARMAMEDVGIDSKRLEKLLENFRQSYRDQINDMK
ncbi:MAG: monovalent cation:proton antiporter-2 (CPA2) family protein [Gammaproteobacteria bacterium]|nr:monovalent cation:proton antiporter-2 (CPA2) family protein [Gammaproteobacteria bacterium]